MAGDLMDLSQREKLVAGIRLSPDLEKNLKTITMALGDSEDLKTHRFLLGPEQTAAACIRPTSGSRGWKWAPDPHPCGPGLYQGAG